MVLPLPGASLTRQMFRQGSTGRLLRFFLRRHLERQVRGDFFFATRCLQLFELKLQLRDLSDELLAPGSEEHPLQLIKQQLEMSDLACTRAEGGEVLLMLGLDLIPLCLELLVLSPDHRLQRRCIHDVQIRQDERLRHRRSMPQSNPF